MSIVLRYNEQLELNLAEYRGAIAFAELEALFHFLSAHPSFLKRDSLSIVAPGAAFADVERAALDRLFAGYARLYESLTFPIVRRSAWLCQSPDAEALVDYWLGDRNALDAVSSTLRRFDTYAEAGDWLVLSPHDASRLERGKGFIELARFDTPAAARSR